MCKIVQNVQNYAKCAKLCNQSINVYYFQQPIGFSKKERLCRTRATGVHIHIATIKGSRINLPKSNPQHTGAPHKGRAEQNREEEAQQSQQPQCEKLCKMCKIVQNVQNCAKSAKSCKMCKKLQNVQNCAKCAELCKIVQNCAKCAKFCKMCKIVFDLHT